MLNNFFVEKSTHCNRRISLVHLIAILLLLLLVGFLSGCAGVDHSAKNQELLAENYHSLSNDDLILYYYKLEDQIAVVERKKNNSSISLGFGLGSYGNSSASSAGVGVSKGGSTQDVATNLRDRRNEVKLELQHRGLNP
ncbi:MAG: hypothetical protein QNK24_05945 [Desulfuromusa sp.]|nr:hypothetical protein [Desulfuromusa sp.]